MAKMIASGYGDVPMDVPVASHFGRYLVEYLGDHDFDVAHVTHVKQQYGGKVARRYPTPDGELNSVRETKDKEQGLPHGFAFIVKRLFNNQPRPIVPVFPAWMPILPWIVAVERPLVPRRTRNAVMPRCPLARSTVANTRKWSATSARLIHCFDPLRT